MKRLTSKQREAKNKKEAKAVLRKVVSVLNRGGQGSSDLWHILTALRGPDNDNTSGLKEAATARIRGFIGLKPYNTSFGAIIQDTPLADYRRIQRDDYLSSANGHFRSHYNRAVASIQDLYGYDLETETKVKK